jgi:uncharacterized membrane protein
MLSAPPAIQCAIPDWILAFLLFYQAQYLFTVTPGIFNFYPINEIKLSPCSASGMAFPTITSSIRVCQNRQFIHHILNGFCC